MFAVIDVETKEREYLFDDGKAAGQYANDANAYYKHVGHKRRVRVVRLEGDELLDVQWQEREANRFYCEIDGQSYRQTPWHFELWRDAEGNAVEAVIYHYCHVSNDDPTKIAFTPDAAHGRADRQMRMRPGRYLQRLRELGVELSDRSIKEWCARYAYDNETLELKLATTPDDIQRVYENGPHSCMAHSTSDYDGPCHPVRVYGAGDLAVAYIEHEGEITARCLVWPAKKVSGRIYGDEGRLAPLLADAGYASCYNTDAANGNFNGARLLRIEDKYDQFVCPYLDPPHSMVDDDGEFLIIRGIDGDYGARETNGLTEGSTCHSCSDCGDRVDDPCYDEDGECYCGSCYDERYARCAHCECEVYRGDAIRYGDEYWCERCADRHLTRCYECDEYHSEDDMHEADGECYCQACFDEKFVCCVQCDEAIAHRDAMHHDGETYCEDCVPSDDEEEPVARPSPTINDPRQIRLAFVWNYPELTRDATQATHNLYTRTSQCAINYDHGV